MTNDWIWDLECFPNCFTAAFQHAVGPFGASFEVSEYRDDGAQLLHFLNWLHSRFARLVGFNSIGFDYNLLHVALRMNRFDYRVLYEKCQAIIQAQDQEDRWSHIVKPSDRIIPQLDLYLINHFDNQARRTSLKALEFNMRADSIEELPFEPGTRLTPEQIVVLRRYNNYDVTMTKRFYHHCQKQIHFREELSQKYHRDFTNHNDTKIGKDFFVMELEKAGVQLYDFGSSGRKPRQTPRREGIRLVEAILPWIRFERPEFNWVLDWMKQQTIIGTKDVLKVPEKVLIKGEESTVYKQLKTKIHGFEFVFGTGGIHGSVENKVIESNDEYVIVDLDVTSYYPQLAIQNGFYPEHLGEQFVRIYSNLFDMRKKYDKKSAESAMLKLALNGTYGDSGNQFSVFYDPRFTMQITLNGQLLLCLLAEQLIKIDRLSLIQINTDGLTVRLPREEVLMLTRIKEWWENVTKMNLEQVTYKRMCIADVNSYIAVKEDGTTKRKGRYEYELGWHQDAGALVVPKVAERVLVEGVPIRKTVEEWPDVMDFMLRVKVPKSGYLEWGDHGTERVQNTTRYLVTTTGAPLTKWLPPTKTKPDKWRSFAIESGWKVTPWNTLPMYPNERLKPTIDNDYYVQAVEKLVMGLK